MTDLRRMLEQLQAEVEWQRLPVVMHDYERKTYISSCLERGLEMQYINIGKATEYTDDLLIRGEDGIQEELKDDLLIDERRYALLSAKIEFFRKVQTDVNNIVGYTTDALTVTNADKPYINLATTISDLEKERRIIHYKMTRHALL